VTVAGAACLAIRISYTGELGWELYPRLEDMSRVYAAVVEAGQDLGIGHVGTRAVNTLRMEKGFRGWGHEMNKDTSPIETGLMPFVRMKKKTEFIGKAGLQALQRVPAATQLVFLAIQGTDIDPEGDESVMLLDKAVGYTTSGCYRWAAAADATPRPQPSAGLPARHGLRPAPLRHPRLRAAGGGRGWDGRKGRGKDGAVCR
jgi:dimethylglycine dehydrogenase